jgi:hypothetical protein
MTFKELPEDKRLDTILVVTSEDKERLSLFIEQSILSKVEHFYLCDNLRFTKGFGNSDYYLHLFGQNILTNKPEYYRHFYALPVQKLSDFVFEKAFVANSSAFKTSMIRNES